MKHKLLIVTILMLLFLPLTRAAEIVPTDAKIEYNNGIDLYKTGKYEDAISAFRTAIRLYPDYLDAYYNLGSILEYLNQGDEAIYVFKQILARNPKDYEASLKVSQVAAKLGDRITASQYAAMIPASDSHYAEARALMAKYNLGNIRKNLATTTKIPQRNSSYLNISSPTGIATDKEGNVYIASFTDNAVIKITPDGKRIIFFKSSMLKGPISIAIDGVGNMFIANYNANNVIKVSRLGAPEVFLESVMKPYAVHVGGNMLFVSCQGSNSVMRVTIK